MPRDLDFGETRAMGGRFVDVYVESNDEIPDECTLRFHALADPMTVHRIRFHPDGGDEGTFVVESRASDGGVRPAYAVRVDDSSAGTSTLVYGAEFGLRLRREGSAEVIAEPYLLLDAGAIID